MAKKERHLRTIKVTGYDYEGLIRHVKVNTSALSLHDAYREAVDLWKQTWQCGTVYRICQEG